MKIKKSALTGIAIALFTVGFASISIAQDNEKDKKTTKTETRKSTETGGGATVKKTSKETVTTKHGKKGSTDTKTTTKTDVKVEPDKK